MLHSLLRGRAIAGGFIAFAVAAAITATALSPASGNGPETATQFSGTSSGAIVTSHNSGTGQAISASGSTGASTGVIYATTAAAGSTAIRGYSTSTSLTRSYGVIGVSKNAYGVEALTYSPSSSALFANNVSTTGTAIKGQSAGNAVTGISTKGHGVVGQTSATPTPAPSAVIAMAGVLGQDTTTSAYNAGVAGTSTLGFGVFGKSNAIGVYGLSTGSAGVYGVSTSSAAVVGHSDSGAGVFGSSGSSYGVSGTSPNSYGVYGNSNSSAGVSGSSSSYQGVHGASSTGDGVFGHSSGSGAGVSGSSTSGYGVLAGTTSGAAALVALGSTVSSPSTLPTGSIAVYGENNDSNTSAAPAVFVQDNASGIILDAFNKATSAEVYADASGNLHISGKIYTVGGTCTTGCVVTKSITGHEITTYSTQGPVPSIEDFGQGQLVGGVAHVSINPDFGSIMDPRYDYLIFITPEGDTQGWLFVAQKSRTGFTVREHGSGHSTVAFDYRIVAKPFASNEARLPIYRPARKRLLNGVQRAPPIHMSLLQRSPSL